MKDIDVKDIIKSFQIEIDFMAQKYGQKPNKIILGYMIAGKLAKDFAMSEEDFYTDHIANRPFYFLGIPVERDYKNSLCTKICLEHEVLLQEFSWRSYE